MTNLPRPPSFPALASWLMMSQIERDEATLVYNKRVAAFGMSSLKYLAELYGLPVSEP